MNNIWRFYIDPNRQWRWQRLAADQSLISESPVGYLEYEKCLAGAINEGYVYHPSQEKRATLAH
jgi:hypothetical protein